MKFNNSIYFIPLSMMLLGACSGEKNADKEETEEAPVVRIAAVEEREVPDLVTLTASVEADMVNNISSSSPNRIKQILVDEGMTVAKGQKLVVLDDVNTTQYQIQVDNAKASLHNAQVNYNRAVELLKIGGGTQQNVDQMELQLISAKNNLSAAERTLRNHQENTVLVSPASGVVTARNYDPGDMTGQQPILTIASIHPVKVVTNVNESDYSKIHKGMAGTLKLETYPDREFTGHITMIAPQIDVNSRTFGVEVTVPNNDNAILPGMFGRISFNLGTANHAVVPDKAVEKQRGSGNYFIYVYKDGKLDYRQVQLGQRLDNAYEIISGVNPGEQVVVSEKSKLRNGQEVTVLK